MNWPCRENRMKPQSAATAPDAESNAGTSHALTAMSPTNVTGQNNCGKIVFGQVPNSSMAR